MNVDTEVRRSAYDLICDFKRVFDAVEENSHDISKLVCIINKIKDCTKEFELIKDDKGKKKIGYKITLPVNLFEKIIGFSGRSYGGALYDTDNIY